jgi:hypothetical protein
MTDTDPTQIPTPPCCLTRRRSSGVAVSLSLYQLYTAGIATLTALVQRSIHLGAILVLTFLLKPPFSAARKDRFEPLGRHGLGAGGRIDLLHRLHLHQPDRNLSSVRETGCRPT